MLNLYRLEHLVVERQLEIARQARQYSLLRQAHDARVGPTGSPTDESSVRSRLGYFLVRIGLRLGNIAIPQQLAGTPQCLCVPVKN